MQPSRLPRPARATLWLFDLDDTLHQATPVIFERMNQSMTEYVMRHVGLDETAANELRREYWQRYGATLLGLMRRHGTDPVHFLAETHQFPDMARIVDYDHRVRLLLKHLPGRKVLVSNAPRHYVSAVLASMGVAGHLHGIETIESMRFVPKPARSSLARLLRRHGAGNRGASQRHRVVMVEDNLENLKSAKRLGLTTVWISRASHKPAFVDFRFRSVLQLARQPFRRAP
jgi:putative hydrolase of the HAD superfamily